MVHELRKCGVPRYDRLSKKDQGWEAEVKKLQQGSAQKEEVRGLRSLLEKKNVGVLGGQAP